MALLTVENLKTWFHTRDGIVRAVDGVSFEVQPGETLGIVGESGSGKSVTQYSLLGLIPTPPGRIESGHAHFEDKDLLQCAPNALRAIRGKSISMIFQDPMTALNPYMRISQQIMEPLRLHCPCTKKDALDQAITALRDVGIQDAENRIHRYPHEFSGGMRQRVMIAMALITQPKLLIADEPTTALDVTVQAQILELIRARQRAVGMSVLLITHDLGVIAGTCDRVLVMYAGRIVEAAPTAELFAAPKHPYTRALLASLPSVHEAGADLYTIPGMPPDLMQPITGCAFAPRCAHAAEGCRVKQPDLLALTATHATACLRVHEEGLAL
ncbi:MAG: ABC transporter ATP-binding protein [Candidatus Hydrogenedentes bacterium]|nr:ABC transporter ATP-binding protein [Candidatus Hydrogenedentota bacterium]